jgi:hypothetical protein
MPRELKEFTQTRRAKDFDIVLLFARSNDVFQREFAALMNTIKVDGTIWVAWPKKSAGIQTDLTENVIRDQALKTHFVDVKVCAIDEIWSGLKLVVRKEYRAALAQKTN